MHIGFLNLSCT